jgi:hypothetical protein
MMLLHQAVEQRLIGRLSDLLERDRADVGECAVKRVVSISIACGRSRRARESGGRKRIAGNSISPARSSISNRPRQTISRGAPLACFHCQTSQSFSDSLRRLAVGWSVINLRMKSISSAVTVRPRYLHSGILCSVAESKLERKGLAYLFLRAHLPPYRGRFGLRVRGRQQ